MYWVKKTNVLLEIVHIKVLFYNIILLDLDKAKMSGKYLQND